MKKYELTDETIEVYGITLHRIKALKDFEDVKKDDLGGFVESETNLSHKGNAWVYGNAWVHGNAKVYGNAWVCGNAEVYGSAKVYGNAWVFGNAKVFGNTKVYGNAEVFGNAEINNDLTVSEINQLFSIDGIGSRNDTTTFVKSGKNIYVNCGCFSGTIDEFLKAVTETHGNNIHGRTYKKAVELAKVYFEEEN